MSSGPAGHAGNTTHAHTPACLCFPPRPSAPTCSTTSTQTAASRNGTTRQLVVGRCATDIRLNPAVARATEGSSLPVKLLKGFEVYVPGAGTRALDLRCRRTRGPLLTSNCAQKASEVIRMLLDCLKFFFKNPHKIPVCFQLPHCRKTASLVLICLIVQVFTFFSIEIFCPILWILDVVSVENLIRW